MSEHESRVGKPHTRSPDQVKVLVVGDDEGDRALICRILQQHSYSVEEARSLSLALDKVNLSPPDLILLDFTTADQEALAALQQIRADVALSQTLAILTASVSEQIRLEALEAGLVDFLTKPIMELVALMGEEIELVAARQNGAFPDVPAESDLCTVLLIRDRKSGAVGTVTASRISTGARDLLEFEIRASGGSLRVSTDTPDVVEVFNEGGQAE